MKVTECKHNVRCELGACRNKATRAIEFDRVGIRGRLNACDGCLVALYEAIGETIIPKSVETGRAKSRRKAEK